MNGRSPSTRIVQWSLLIGLPAALVLGISSCRDILANYEYLRFHLYRSALRLLVPRMDRAALYAVGLLLALFLAGWIGRRIKGRPGGALQIILPLAVFGAVAGYYRGMLYYLAMLWKMPMQAGLRAAGAFLVGPIGLGIMLAILVLVLIRLRAARLRGDEPAARPAGKGWRLAGRIVSIAAVGSLSLLMLAFLGINIAAGALWAGANHAMRDRPNVIFIMVDTLRADHVGCYGYDLPTTPNIDRFAAESTRFAHPVAQASWTIWSVDSLMTSRFPDRLVANGTGSDLGPGSDLHPYYPTLAKVLKEQGYATHAVISNPLLRNSPGNVQGYDSYDVGPTNDNRDCNETSPLVNKAVKALLPRIRDRKFFLSLVYMDPHSPYFLNKGYEYGVSSGEAARVATLAGDNDPAKMAERRQKLHAYDSEIGYTDHYVGELLDELKNQGLYDDALIVLFSDHGEEFLEHKNFDHMKTVYDEVIRVPLIIKLPRINPTRQRQGKVVPGSFPLIDLYPSLLAYLHIDRGALGLQGDAIKFDDLLSCAKKPVFSSTVDGVRCVINGGFKYIESNPPRPKLQPGKKIPPPASRGQAPVKPPFPPSAAGMRPPAEQKIRQLYNLTKDPLERHNLVKDKTKEVVELARWLRERNKRQLPSDIALRRGEIGGNGMPGPPPDASRLKALGYAN